MIINAIDAACEYYEHPAPVHIFRLIADDKFPEKVLADTDNPLLTMFCEQYDEKLRDSEQMSKFSPPINKVGKLLRPFIIPIIDQTKSLDFLGIMNSRKNSSLSVSERAPRGRNRSDTWFSDCFDCLPGVASENGLQSMLRGMHELKINGLARSHILAMSR